MDEYTTAHGVKPMTYADYAAKTMRTIKAHVDKDGHVALVAVGLSADEIRTACDRIKVLVS